MADQLAEMYKRSEFDNQNFLSAEVLETIDEDLKLSLGDMGEIDTFQYLQDEDTMESAQKFNPQYQSFIPVSPSGPPETKNYAGPLNFEVEIEASETDKRKYVYSARLNRIYVDVGVNFPVHFSWNPAEKDLMYPQGQDMHVRATVVFSDRSQAEKRVERCLQHAHEANNPVLQAHGRDEALVKNVLRSARELGTAGVYYCGEAARADSWLSVLVRLPSPGAHAFQFVCKNSCSSGINRRAIAIIFTLEDSCGNVVGRQSVGARVCACPKRDLSRDEAEVGKGKRRIKQTPTDNLKKVKIEVVENDDEVIYLPKIPIKGIKTVLTGLEVMQRMMEVSVSEVAKRKDQKELEEYNNCLASLVAFIGNLKRPKSQQTQ